MSYIHILHVIIIMKNLMQHNFSFFYYENEKLCRIRFS